MESDYGVDLPTCAGKDVVEKPPPCALPQPFMDVQRTPMARRAYDMVYNPSVFCCIVSLSLWRTNATDEIWALICNWLYGVIYGTRHTMAAASARNKRGECIIQASGESAVEHLWREMSMNSVIVFTAPNRQLFGQSHQARYLYNEFTSPQTYMDRTSTDKVF